MDKYMKKITSQAAFQIGWHDSNRPKSKESSDLLSHIPNQIKIMNAKSIEISKHFAMDNSGAFNLSHFIGKAFITFRYQHYRGYFLREAEKNPNFFKLSDQPLSVERAGEPVDIFWKNLKITNEQRNEKNWISFFILILVVIFSFTVLLLVNRG